MSQFSRQSEDMTFQSVSCCLDPALLHPEHLPDKKWHLQKRVKFKIRVWLPEVSLVFYRVESCHSSELRRETSHTLVSREIRLKRYSSSGGSAWVRQTLLSACLWSLKVWCWINMSHYLLSLMEIRWSFVDRKTFPVRHSGAAFC